jgi:hypothetical protein
MYTTRLPKAWVDLKLDLLYLEIDALLTDSQVLYRGETEIGIPPVSKLLLILTNFSIVEHFHSVVAILKLIILNKEDNAFISHINREIEKC